jgi:hypothetical protein
MVQDNRSAAEFDRAVVTLRRAILWIWLGWLVFLVAIIVFLNAVELPSRLSPWFMVFVLLFVLPAVATGVLRMRINDLQVKAARAQVADLNRTIDEIEELL